MIPIVPIVVNNYNFNESTNKKINYLKWPWK